MLPHESGMVVALLEVCYYALPAPDSNSGISSRRAGADVAVLRLPGARISRRVADPAAWVAFPAAHHHRVRLGTKQRVADGGDQPFVAIARRHHRSGWLGRWCASPIAAVS